ncbi:MAG: HD domain-containing protein [Firmicutes bacterium]|jgi:3'-5' exoribonuclease|nr:HD domain-containing protein [Bacillota bacterium]
MLGVEKVMLNNHTQGERQRITDLEQGQPVNSIFMAKSKQLSTFASRPGYYLTLVLFDRTGEIRAILWDDGENVYNSFQDGDVVCVKGFVGEYRGTPQITIETLHKCTHMEYDLSLFLPRTTKNVEELLNQLIIKVEGFSNTYLKKLVLTFLEDPKFAAAYIQAPAAKTIHHAVIGGLIEHTVNVVALCETISRLYPVIDNELLITGAILHDIGKLMEYKYDGPFDLSDEGKLIGHIVIGERMIAQAVHGIPGFPNDLSLKIRHMILSHHGKLEWGSPKRPKTLEAIVLHLADYSDAFVAQFVDIVEDNKDTDGNWSVYNKRLDRQIYLG